ARETARSLVASQGMDRVITRYSLASISSIVDPHDPSSYASSVTRSVAVLLVAALLGCGHPHASGGGDAGGGGDANASRGDGGGTRDDGGSGGGGDADKDGGTSTGECAHPTCARSLGSGLGAGMAVVVDSHRNVYVAGHTQGPMTFGGHVFTPHGTA